MTEKFEAKTYLKCTECEEVIFSTYSGHYKTCKCGQIGVDETEFYVRIIGGKWITADKPEEE